MSGLAYEYIEEYPYQLEGYIKEDEFLDCISTINNTIKKYWPCLGVQVTGYACCLCTCGLSLFLPGHCVSNAELSVMEEVEFYND